jgi:hypothetical protein
MVKTAVPVAPCPRVSVAGLTEIEKSGAMGALTVTLRPDDVAPAKFASPEYEAVMLLVPAGREATSRVAAPFESGAALRFVPPIKNETVPVALRPCITEGFRVAVKTTCPP